MPTTTWLPSVLLFVVGTILAIIAYFLRQIYTDIRQEQKEQRSDHAQLRSEFESFKEQLPYRFVLRDDWIRATMNLEQKLDKVYDLIVERLQQTAKSGGD